MATTNGSGGWVNAVLKLGGATVAAGYLIWVVTVDFKHELGETRAEIQDSIKAIETISMRRDDRMEARLDELIRISRRICVAAVAENGGNSDDCWR